MCHLGKALQLPMCVSNSCVCILPFGEIQFVRHQASRVLDREGMCTVESSEGIAMTVTVNFSSTHRIFGPFRQMCSQLTVKMKPSFVGLWPSSFRPGLWLRPVTSLSNMRSRFRRPSVNRLTVKI